MVVAFDDRQLKARSDCLFCPISSTEIVIMGGRNVTQEDTVLVNCTGGELSVSAYDCWTPQNYVCLGN